MNQNRFTFWYFTVSFVFILLENLNFTYPAFAVKALIIPSLMVFYHFSVRRFYTSFHRLILLGLFFSWLGDIFLQMSNPEFPSQFAGEKFFIAGLVSFLITHLIYIVAFILPKGKNTLFGARIYQTLLVILYGAIMLYYLYRSLGDMKIPVITYTVIILLMLLAALNRYGKVNGLSYILVVLGAILFVASDSLIAVTKFHTKIDFGGVIIMITYVAAQYLIVLGCLRQDIILSQNE